MKMSIVSNHSVSATGCTPGTATETRFKANERVPVPVVTVNESSLNWRMISRSVAMTDTVCGAAAGTIGTAGLTQCASFKVKTWPLTVRRRNAAALSAEPARVRSSVTVAAAPIWADRPNGPGLNRL
jgi:hypothetical protein